MPAGQDGLEELSDEELAGQVADGSLPALSALYDRYASRVYGLSLRVVRQPMAAEEVTQDAFLALWRLASVYRPGEGSFASWFLTLTRNLAIDALRRRQARERALERAFGQRLESQPAAPGPEEGSVERATLMPILARLPSEQREVVELAFYGGYTHRQIAEATSTPLGTVKTRIRLALEKIRAGLDSQSGASRGSV